MAKDTRVWAYKDGVGELFPTPADVPPGWSDTPAGQPKTPKVMSATPPPPEQPDGDPPLRDQAEALGIKVDGRWSEKRLADEVRKAKDGFHA